MRRPRSSGPTGWSSCSGRRRRGVQAPGTSHGPAAATVSKPSKTDTPDDGSSRLDQARRRLPLLSESRQRGCALRPSRALLL